MKIEIIAELTDVTADGPIDTQRHELMTAFALAYHDAMSDLRRKRLEIDLARLDEERRWRRFIRYCQTGIME